MKVLVAEDDKVSRLVLTTALRKLGHEVVEAEDGREAWRRYQRENLQVVITDWMMPNMDGLELSRCIRSEQRSKYTYVIMLTALGGKNSYLEGMDAGADDFITKPFDMEEMNARLRVAERILNLQDEIRQLEGLLPICSYCKRIRTGANSWQPLEIFIADQTDASFSHGVCPECFELHLKPQLEFLRKRRAQRGIGIG
jgi:DNA-binding response OmpR family regulator